MKQIILSIAISITSIAAMTQMNVRGQLANYEAVNWKTWLLDNAKQITIVAPPAARSKS